ncbi:MAG: nucleotide exchange factor GrpE, partial [Promethearchaeota archaeon]
ELNNKINDLEKSLREQEEINKKLLEEKENWKNKYIHLQAEFENAQKRWERNRQDLKIQFTASVLKNFLPLYDSFKKAIETVSKENDNIKQFYNQFLNILKSYKAEPIQIKVNEDIFDYNLHEALTSLERNDLPNNTIIDVIQDGWKIDKDILRYAKVITSRKPKKVESKLKVKESEDQKEKKEPKQNDGNKNKKSK